MDIQELLDVFKEIDADEIVDHTGDKDKLKKASAILYLAQEGIISSFNGDDLDAVSYDSMGHYIGDDFDWVLEEMRERRLKMGIECFPEIDADLMADLIWDKNFCCIDYAKFEFNSMYEVEKYG